MAAAKLKLFIEQGSTYRKTLTWQAGTPPVPVDLSGCTARMHIRDEIASATILLSLTTENTYLTLEALAGTINLYLPASITAAITWETAVYDIEIVFPAQLSGTTLLEPDVQRLVYGQVSTSLEVTR